MFGVMVLEINITPVPAVCVAASPAVNVRCDPAWNTTVCALRVQPVRAVSVRPV